MAATLYSHKVQVCLAPKPISHTQQLYYSYRAVQQLNGHAQIVMS